MPPTRVRLRDTVEVFNASGGETWISHGGSTATLVIRDASARERALLGALRGPALSAAELAGRLRTQGHEVSLEEAEQSIDQLRRRHLVEDPGAALESGLDEADRERYDRQLAYFADLHGQAGAYESQRRLERARVVILGCGGLGSWTALALLCSGIRDLVLVDDDHVALSNLNRQVVYSHADVGRKKVAAARDALLRFDPRARVAAIDERICDPARLERLARGADLLVATADEPPGTIGALVNDACLATGTPWISAGQFPPQVRVGPLYVPGATACHRCAERAAERTHRHYAELARLRGRRPVLAATTGPASGLIGTVLANDVVAWLGGIHLPATLGNALAIDLRTLAITSSPVEPDADCDACAGALSSPRPAGPVTSRPVAS